MFISWYNIMSTKNKNITRNSKICEVHFKSEDVIKEDAFVQADGTVIYITRRRPKLKEEAVPSIFPKQKMSYFQQIQHNNSDDVMRYEQFSTECETSDTVLHSAEIISSTSHVINESLQIKDRLFIPLKETTPKFSIEDINIANNIETPTRFWFANINNSCMMWTCWTDDFSHILRRVIVKSNMEVTVNIIE